MEKIAIYGKGGIGKSVISTNISACLARDGKRVLHVGCDPKHDSSIKLIKEKPIKTVLDVLGRDSDSHSIEHVINMGKFGIHCIESGGPEPGVGCGGRGVAKTIEFMDMTEILQSDHYDAVVFDVLGDVVCGGFAAPLRAGIADKVFIVVSEEPMALYAANNISKAIETYRMNGIVLGGLIANMRSNESDRKIVVDFAARLNTSIVNFIKRDPIIIEAEKKRMTVIEYAFESETTLLFKELVKKILSLDVRTIPLPSPMTDDEFFDFIGK